MATTGDLHTRSLQTRKCLSIIGLYADLPGEVLAVAVCNTDGDPVMLLLPRYLRASAHA